MPQRRSRRRGDWARRLTANMDPLSSDSDVFPCDSSCSSDSFSSHDNYLPRRQLPELPIPTSPPPLLDIRDLAFSDYAAAELPDLAIFFRNIIPPFTSPPPPYSHRFSSFNSSLSDLSLAMSRSPRSPRPPRHPPRSGALPPAFPGSARRPMSARHISSREKSFLEHHSENHSSLNHPQVLRSISANTQPHSPPTSPPKLHRSRSAPIRPSAFPSQSSMPRRTHLTRQNSSVGETTSNEKRKSSHQRSSLRRSSSLRQQSSSGRRRSEPAPSGELPNGLTRRNSRRNFAGSPRLVTTRRYPEDLELSAQTGGATNPSHPVDPDSLKHFFLVEKIYRWYSDLFLLTGDRCVLRVQTR